MNYYKIQTKSNILTYDILPIIIVFISSIVENYNDSLSFMIKIFALSLMFFVIIIKNNYHKEFLYLSLLFIFMLIINTINSYNYNAALESLIRFLFLPIVLLYAYTIKEKSLQITKVIIFFALISNFIYIYNVFHEYLNFGPSIIEYRTKDSGYLFNAGFFDVSNAILQLSAFIFIYEFDKSKYKLYKLFFFFFLTLFTFSYKTLPFLFIYLFIKANNQQKLIVLILLVIFLSIFSNTIDDTMEILRVKLSVYIFEGGSARFESYRVMFETLFNGNFFGLGLGTFGGPESIKYNSTIYQEYHFNWGWMNFLKTTDTSYPHLFVELGIIGSIIFILLMYLPVKIIKEKSNKIPFSVSILYSAYLFECIFSYGLFNLLELTIVYISLYGLSYATKN